MTNPTQHGPWQIVARTEVYRDPWVELDRDDVIRPDGRPGTHVVVRLMPGVSVLPIDDSGTVYLTEEFHYAVGRTTIEAVSGGIEAGEEPQSSARRELEEELGITADQWLDLGLCDPFTSVVTSPTRLYLARGLSFGAANLEGTERIRCQAVSLAEAVAMVLDSRITHAPSCLLIMKAYYML